MMKVVQYKNTSLCANNYPKEELGHNYVSNTRSDFVGFFNVPKKCVFLCAKLRIEEKEYLG